MENSCAVDAKDVSRFVSELKARGIKAVAFDMDQCMVAQHSQGDLRKEYLPGFIERVTPDFKAVVPALAAEGFHLAIATHSDAADYSWWKGTSRETHLFGEDLVKPVLKEAVPDQAHLFFIVALKPPSRVWWWVAEANKGKRQHISLIAEHYGIERSQVALFDDQPRNIDLSDGFPAFKVDVDKGFRISDLLG